MVFNKTSGVTQLESIAWDGGRIVAEPDGWGGTNMVPYLYSTDHLGSVRAVRNALTGAVVSRSDYEPYGAHTTLSGTPQRYRYNGKEDQSFAGTPYLDYGARQYDPAIGRWMVPDPLAEHYFSVSPYSHCHDNPINRIDADGQFDWQLFWRGAAVVATGALSAAAIVFTGGTATPIAEVLFVSSLSSIGIGTAMSITGAVSTPSEKTKTISSTIPTSLINALGKSGDIIMENQNHQLETMGNALEFAGGAITSAKGIWHYISIVSATGSFWLSTMSSNDTHEENAKDQVDTSSNDLDNRAKDNTNEQEKTNRQPTQWTWASAWNTFGQY